jgi:hypothetical protein
MIGDYLDSATIDNRIYALKKSINDSDERLRVYHSKTIFKQVRLWLHKLSTLDHTSPTFIYNDLTDNLMHTIDHTSKFDIYIAHTPQYWLEPAHIGCFKFNPEKKTLSIEKICSNPFMGFYTLKSFKKLLYIIAENSNTTLDIQPLVHYANQRYFLDFYHFD